MEKLFEKLENYKKRLTWIDKMLENVAFLSDIEKVKKISKERVGIEKIMSIYDDYLANEKKIEEARILSSDEDIDIAELARIELEDGLKKKDILFEELKMALIPKDPKDEKDVIVEIRGAAGGDEANIFAGDLFRMYVRYAESQNWKIQVLNSNPSDAGGFSFISFSVSGDNVYSKLKFESGAHRVQRVPKTEAQGRIHTSTSTVVVMPEADDVDVEIKSEDLDIDYYRASGAGGQHINKTESAVRLTHRPTGIVVTCQDGRSQHDNKATAMMILKTKVFDELTRIAELERGSEKKSKIGTGDRSEKIRTYNYPQNRVTDHRINLTLQQLDRIIEGDLGSIIDSLIVEEQRIKLQNAGL